MMNWLFKLLFSFDRPVIRCKRPGCNRQLHNETSRFRGFSDECWRKERERHMPEITKSMEEIEKELQPK